MISWNAKERIRMIRLLEKLSADPAYAAALGIEGGLVPLGRHDA